MSQTKILSYKTTKVVLNMENSLSLEVFLKDDEDVKYVLPLSCKDGFSDDASAFIKQLQIAIDKGLTKRHKQIWDMK